MTNTITLITGAPGSGKSTVGRLVAEHFPKSLLINVDHLREMMVSGFASPADGWSEVAYQQFQRARTTAIYMAQLYASQGVDVVIDDVCVPYMFADHYTALFENSQAQRILLMPKLETLIERIKQRGNQWDHVLVEVVPEIYSYLDPMPKDGWIVLDSSAWTIEQTVQKVLSRIDNHKS
ncbi:MAG: AAA family ATPase [Chloroflexota bacterium]